jgi:glycerate dehydrogenase
MKIVFLDRKTIGEDIDLEKYRDFGEVVMYDFSTPEETAERVRDADILVLNKALVNEETIGTAEHLQLVCVTATGTNNLDKDYLAKRGIAWRNVAGYSTDSVAQHTFAMLFYLYEHLAYYDAYVKNEKYIGDRMFTHFDQVFHELSHKTWGIIGLGNIGHKVAQIAEAFGCNVQYYSTSGQNNDAHYQRVDLDTLLSTSDVLSIHAPLNDDTFHLLDKTAFHKMKPSAILLNVGRGPIIVEQDLAEALEQGVIAGAGVDVLDREPMSPDNPLRQIKDSDKLLITPHIAWASVEARTRLMDIIYQQIQEFFAEQK